jgi:hypothetical protein
MLSSGKRPCPIRRSRLDETNYVVHLLLELSSPVFWNSMVVENYTTPRAFSSHEPDEEITHPAHGKETGANREYNKPLHG